MLTVRTKPMHGFTLVELLISLVIGLIITAAGISIFVNTAGTDFYQLKVTRLNQELRSTMNLMVRDIRRIGYIGPTGLSGVIGTGIWNPFITPDNGANFLFSFVDVSNGDANAATRDCILFALDQDMDGVDDGNSERFGYRLNANAIKVRPNTGVNCTGNGWESITDENTTKITSLTFTPHYQQAGTGGTLVICTIDISLTGELLSDPSVKRTINESVKLRNDIYVPPAQIATWNAAAVGAAPCK